MTFFYYNFPLAIRTFYKFKCCIVSIYNILWIILNKIMLGNFREGSLNPFGVWGCETNVAYIKFLKQIFQVIAFVTNIFKWILFPFFYLKVDTNASEWTIKDWTVLPTSLTGKTTTGLFCTISWGQYLSHGNSRD